LIQVLDAALVQISFNVPCCLIGNIKGSLGQQAKQIYLKKRQKQVEM